MRSSEIEAAGLVVLAALFGALTGGAGEDFARTPSCVGAAMLLAALAGGAALFYVE